ncbi:serine/threonine protein kinase [Absiella sp. AM29-15]|uniref:serine/threonine protein kinase n=1 Tax=Absiella sp. AM29-15 TaxID=2292278 RepID=UPI001314B75C|nr:protein kinase [Absiella sp. AM29-15]
MCKTYQKIRLLGKGGMSQVWLVEHLETKKRYACKICKKDDAKSALYASALRKEACLLAGLHHPMIPSLIEYDPKGSFVMEYIEGESLDQYIGRKISRKQLITWMKEVRDILDYLHYHGIYYLDVKPQNLICDKQKHLHLIDFGVSVSEENQKVYALTPRLWSTGVKKAEAHCHM